jgi:AcrR family transcriptional regulator
MVDEKPLRADARRNRDAIIAAARAVFEHDEQLRFDDFAARAGVGVGTLYRHFPTREALAAAVYRGEVVALCEQARDSSGLAADSLDAFLRAFVDYVVEHAALARTLATVVDPATQAEGGNELERTLAELMGRAAADGAIRDDVTPASVMLALHGIGAATDRPEWVAEARAVAALIIRGLKVD